MQIMPVLAVTEDEVAAHGKEATAGSIFIWFLCAIAFLKISQKIDSFMSSLGINVGQDVYKRQQQEQLRMGPHVCAVQGHIDGNIPYDGDPLAIGVCP